MTNNITTYIKNIEAANRSMLAIDIPADGYTGGMSVNEHDALHRIATTLNLDPDSEEYGELSDALVTACGRLHNGMIAALEDAATEEDWDMGEYCEACEYIADCFATITPVDDDRICEILASKGKPIYD